MTPACPGVLCERSVLNTCCCVRAMMQTPWWPVGRPTAHLCTWPFARLMAAPGRPHTADTATCSPVPPPIPPLADTATCPPPFALPSPGRHAICSPASPLGLHMADTPPVPLVYPLLCALTSAHFTIQPLLSTAHATSPPLLPSCLLLPPKCRQHVHHTMSCAPRTSTHPRILTRYQFCSLRRATSRPLRTSHRLPCQWRRVVPGKIRLGFDGAKVPPPQPKPTY